MEKLSPIEAIHMINNESYCHFNSCGCCGVEYKYELNNSILYQVTVTHYAGDIKSIDKTPEAIVIQKNN